MNYNYGREHLEYFENGIISGRISSKELKHLVESKQLSNEQLQIVSELAPMVGGMNNVSNVGSNNQPQQQQQAPVQDTNTQNNQQQQIAASQRAQKAQWYRLNAILKKAGIVAELQKLSKLFPQDQTIKYYADYINQAVTSLGQHLATQYPYMQANQQQQPQQPVPTVRTIPGSRQA